MLSRNIFYKTYTSAELILCIYTRRQYDKIIVISDDPCGRRFGMGGYPRQNILIDTQLIVFSTHARI